MFVLGLGRNVVEFLKTHTRDAPEREICQGRRCDDLDLSAGDLITVTAAR